MRFRARQHVFDFPRPALVMGIVNVTPDSFSDGGKALAPADAVRHGLNLADQGADILDIGGESTRPGAAMVPVEEELQRVIPVIRELTRLSPLPLSIDTQKPEVAAAALAAGASVVNDIAANREDPAMWRIVAAEKAGYVCMHMRGTPQTMQNNPVYADVVGEVDEFFEERLRRLAGCGVDTETVALDIGIGFGKTLEHNLKLLSQLRSFKKHGRPLLLGVSRKSFLGRLTGAEVNDRLPGALACTVLAAAAGTEIIRTHDVAETRQALRVAEAVLAQHDPCGKS